MPNETHRCDLCGTPFRPRREGERFCCRGCALVHGLVGQSGARPARVVKSSGFYRWIVGLFFLFLAGVNFFISSSMATTIPSLPTVLFLLAVLFFVLGVSVLLSGGRAGRSVR